MSPLCAAGLISLALALAPSSARAWDARAADADRRLSEAPRPSLDPRGPKPGWASRIDRPEERVHWAENFKGHEYVFSVGLAREIDNLPLKTMIAEDRARASLIERIGPVQSDRMELSDGRIITVTTAVVNGARIADWYLDPSGDLYVLAVLVR